MIYSAEYLTRALDAYVKAMNKVETVSATEAGVLSCGLWVGGALAATILPGVDITAWGFAWGCATSGAIGWVVAHA